MVPDKPWPTTPASTVLYTSDLAHQLRRELVVFGGAPSLELTTWRPLSNAPA